MLWLPKFAKTATSKHLQWYINHESWGGQTYLVVNGSNLSITLALNFEIGRVIVVAVVRSQDDLI